MKKYARQLLLFAVCQAVIGLAAAAPVTYTFATGPYTNDGFPSPLATLLGSSIAGSFVYDPAAPLGGSATNANFTNASVYFSAPPSAAPYSSLSATVSGGGLASALSISDPRGTSTVSNDGFVSPPGTPVQDFMSLDADPFGPTGVHNTSGFSIDGFTLVNMRMFWAEFTLGVDFLNDQSLPSVLPSGPARLSLDFLPVGSQPATPTTFAFYDDVRVTAAAAAIPEPDTYALFLAAFGALGFVARRRKRFGPSRSISAVVA